jgi:hypothetical protein
MDNVLQPVSSASWFDEIRISNNTFEVAHGHTSQALRTVKVFLYFLETLVFQLTHHKICLFSRVQSGKDLSQTISWLKNTYGEQRISRQFSYLHLDENDLRKKGFLFTKKQLSTLFCSLLLLTKDDYEDVLSELKSDRASVRGIDGEPLARLRALFSGKKSIHECSSSDLASLESLLLPFKEQQEKFLHEHSLGSSFRPSLGIFPIVKRVAKAQYILQHNRLSQEDWEIIFAKRLCQPQLPHNLLIRNHQHEYYELKKEVKKAGASILLFSPVFNTQLPVLICFRGTRGLMRTDGWLDSLRSIKEDFRKEIGSFGVVSTYDEVKELLTNPTKGCVSSPTQRVHCIGYSLGGPQAQRLTVLFNHRISRLTAICSPGVDRKTAYIFRNIMEKRKGPPLEINYINEAEDIVNFVGEEHIGGGCSNTKLTFRKLIPAPLLNRPPLPSDSGRSLISKLLFLRRQLGLILKAHTRLAITKPHQAHVISTENSETKVLANRYAWHAASVFDLSWERLRQSFCFFRSPNFAEFVRQKLGNVAA